MALWMKTLSDHYNQMRERYPDDRLMILFDIDGTIFDTRYIVYDALKTFDGQHGTAYFGSLDVADIALHEKNFDQWFEKLDLHDDIRTTIVHWFITNFWSPAAIVASQHPFAGVMDVIRWFQIQPNTYVGLNTGRNESVRTDTLRSLNHIGKEYRVEFKDSQLYMSPHPWGEKIISSKVEGMRYFQQNGYRVFAFVDNEPENLLAVAAMDHIHDILLLHADTIFASKRQRLPARAVSGSKYDITELAHKNGLPRHVQFVWHGINGHNSLKQFLITNIQWAECDLCLDPHSDEIILCHNYFETTPLSLSSDKRYLTFQELLVSLSGRAKNVKIDLKEDGSLIDKIFEVLAQHRMSDDRLWFSGSIGALQENGFRKIAQTYPQSIIQCPIDFLAPEILDSPARARKVLQKLSSWGINRFSIKWKTPRMPLIIEMIEQWGFELNIYKVPDLESFLKAVLLLPCSITSDFNFPKWHYHGRGYGPQRSFDEYTVGCLSESFFWGAKTNKENICSGHQRSSS